MTVAAKSSYDRENYLRYRESILARLRVYRAENPEIVKAQWKAHYDRNKEARNARSRAYHAANRERLNARSRQYQSENREALNAYKREYLKANKEIAASLARRKVHARRARLKGVQVIPFTAAQLDQRMSVFGYKCWMCGAPWEAVDHVKPLARGGAHILCNLRPACQSCNSRKGAK
jgi:5-methylcytosine-specific restriction endonuclease McrA